MTDSENRTLNDKFMLRLPNGMRDRVKAEADKNGRSMNAEIVALLDQHFPPLPDFEDVLDSARLTAQELDDMLRTEKDAMGTKARWLARALLQKLKDVEQAIERR